MPQLNLATFPSQIFWLLVTFGALFLLVRFFILPRLERIKDARWERQDNNLQRAQELLQEAEVLSHKTELMIQRARDEASQLLATTEQNLKVEAENTLKAVQIELQVQFQETEKALKQQKEECLNEVKVISADIADHIMTHSFQENLEGAVKKAVQKTSSSKAKGKADVH